MDSFAAIDVETANADFASICQIGIVQFVDGAESERWQSFVNPEDAFDAVNVSIHGITPEMVTDAPTFSDLLPVIATQTANRILVCHTAFDRISLRQACEQCDGSLPLDIVWLDSARVARRAWPDQCGRKGYGLRDLSVLLSMSFKHHEAAEDAFAAGSIILLAMAATGLSLSDWLKRVEHPVFGTASGIAQDGNPEGPLAGESICFTGALGMVRGRAASIAAAAGCEVTDGVTKRTTLLVVGDQDIDKLAGHEKSTKHRKAEALVETGQRLRILAESDFLRLMQIEGIETAGPSSQAKSRGKRAPRTGLTAELSVDTAFSSGMSIPQARPLIAPPRHATAEQAIKSILERPALIEQNEARRTATQPKETPMALAGLMYCPNCGGVNAPVTRMKGSLVLNLFLTLLLFFPGMLYFVWRLTTRGKVCRACSATGMIPLDSPKARAALAVKA